MLKNKTINVLFIICVIAFSACTSAKPTGSSNNVIETAVPGESNNNNLTPTAETTPKTSDGTSTLACDAGSQSASLTPEVTEGPYFKAGSPEETNLYQQVMAGTKLVIIGYVYTTDCQPVTNALLDFWQADASGNYDNSGYTLRGHQFTDANGRYQLTTVVPGIYPGRTEHIHVKVQAPNVRLITTQLFFPGVSQNEGDNIFQESLLLKIQQTSDGE